MKDHLDTPGGARRPKRPDDSSNLPRQGWEAPGRQERTIWTAWEAPGGTREAGKDHLDSLGGTREAERTSWTACEAPGRGLPVRPYVSLFPRGEAPGRQDRINWTACEAPGRHQRGRKGLIGQPVRHQGGTARGRQERTILDSLRGTREAGKDHLDSLGGTREAGKD